MAYTQAGARAIMLAHQMKLQAAAEKHPQHERHVDNQINYANAVAEAYNDNWKLWVERDLPKLIDQEIEKYMRQSKIEPKVDEKSLAEAKRKITEMVKSIFQ